MLNPNNKQPLSATTSTTEELNNLSLPPQPATRSTSNPILPSSDDGLREPVAGGPQARSASQLNKMENTNIPIDAESNSYSPSLEHSSFFSRNYNESLIRLLSNGQASGSSNQPQSTRTNPHSMLNNLFNFKSLSGSILSSIQKPFQNAAAAATGSSSLAGGTSQYESSHTCNLGYRLSGNLSDNELNRTSVEPLIDPQIAGSDSPHYFSSRYQAFTNDSPSFSASSSNNFSFNTVNTASTGLTSVASKQASDHVPSSRQTINGDEQLLQSSQPPPASTDDLNGVSNGHSNVTKSSSVPGANLLNNNIFKLNLDINLGDEQNAFNMSGNASLSSKQLTIYEKRYLLAVERGDLAGVRRMIEMAPQIEQQEKEKGDYNGPVFNINCTDPIGRSALLMAIDNENVEMIELLVECGVQMKDSLLHAINEEFVEAVELLLDYEEALQRNKRAALEASLESKNDPDAAKQDLDKPITFSFDFRPTLLQTKETKDDEKNGADTHSLGSFSQKAQNGNQREPSTNLGKPMAAKNRPFSQVQNAICNKLSLNSNASNGLAGGAGNRPAPGPPTNAPVPVPPIVYSWEGLIEDRTFTNDVTPLILAAHKNNYEIIKLLLDRGISPIPCPHDARCGCRECAAALQSDCLRYSRSRINAYRALASPSLIALSSRDPIHTAFELSWQLRRLSFLEPEFKSEYVELRKQCQAFATALLDHTRTHYELEVLLNYEPDSSSCSGSAASSSTSRETAEQGRMHLARLKLAIRYKQKKFCAHANVQQLLASIWYEGLPGFRRRNIVVQIMEILFIGILFPVFALAYIVAPYSKFGQIIKKPFIKFICHSASYMTFLILLALASQRIETNAFDIFGVNSSSKTITKRGAPPTLIELMVLAWVIGLIWSEIKQLWALGLFDYMSDAWNILDFITNSLYVATITLRIIAYLQVQKEIAGHTGTASLPREDWDAFDPILLAEGLFAAANIFSSLKLVYIFSVNPHLGPLQISLGRMVVDILKFFSVYILVLFAFACGMNQLLWYYADMEKQVCIGNTTIITNLTNLRPTDGTFINNPTNNNNRRFKFKSLKSANEACLTWRRFANLFESFQTLFWASFGLIDLENFELTGIQSYTRFWGLLMFGCYCVINVVVLLNLLIAMMNHSYQSISEQADTEWKFARTKLWMSYFEDGATVPPPFNVVPTPKSFVYFFKWFIRKFCSQTKFAKNEALKTIRRKAREATQRDYRYQNVIRLLVRRYITNEQRIAERKRGVTEDDCNEINEIKQDISALRYELIELMNKRANSHQALNGCPNCLQGDLCDCFDPIYCNKPSCFSGGGIGSGGKKCADDADETQSGSYHYAASTTSKSNMPLSGSYSNLNQVSTGKRDRQKERRLMKGFDFNCLYLDSNTSLDSKDCALLMQNMAHSSNQNLLLNNLQSLNGAKGKPPNRNRFMRLARGIASKRTRSNTNFLSNLNSSLMNGSRTDSLASNNKWKQLIEATRNNKAIKPIFSRSSESVNSDGVQNLKINKKEIGNYQLDANVKRSLFARKITSLLLRDSHFSLDTGQDVSNLKEMSSSLSKTLSSNSSEINSSDMDQLGDLAQHKMKNEWI